MKVERIFRLYGSPLSVKFCLWHFALSIIGSGIIVGYWLIANYWAVAPRGSDFPLVMSTFFVALTVSAAVLCIPTALLVMILKSARKMAMLALISSLTLCLAFFSGRDSANRVRMAGFRELAKRSDPLIAAIEAYSRTQGHPPATLRKLVPEFLLKVPRTGMKAYPRYEYVTGKNSRTFDLRGNTWGLYVSTSFGLSFDIFMYLPTQNYPSKGYEGTLERVGKWAYVHE